MDQGSSHAMDSGHTIAFRPQPSSGLRLSGVLEGLSHALDLTEGHPRGHAARSSLIGLRIGRALGLSPTEQTELLYALLLKDAGCSSNAPVVHDLFGGADQEVKRAVWLRDWRRVPQQLSDAWEHIGKGSTFVAKLRLLGRLAMLGPRGSGERIFTVRCERGAEIARMIGFSDRVSAAIRAMDEHWDGGGYPYGLKVTPFRSTPASSAWRRSWKSSGTRPVPTARWQWPGAQRTVVRPRSRRCAR